MLTYNHILLKEVFVFDFYNNEKLNEIKIGFRFVFQSSTSTITDENVNEVMNLIIKHALSSEKVRIPGLK